ncbi:hypothetical protein IQ227_17890 [Anabaena aphanizomenioides LEGE 00250]|uniref:Uncharacterized protein n=1 Tax=Sphaerospermopsis aphanizomenoides LEGE 00250 TaxID=2777972 RepID=A0ABR9VH76_9CYAN|nr:hypothetical protein [Sphaerospermopsis aphanizomenoides]MBE9237849.1 hypothetical protein [Sphaerospermopsis aphanizomenoides LEGE 00250]
MIINYYPITNHQSPITNHQSPVTSHQSPLKLFFQEDQNGDRQQHETVK